MSFLSCSTHTKNNEEEIHTISLKPGEVKKIVLQPGVLKEKDEVFCKEKRIPWFTNKEKTLFFISESYFSELNPFYCIRKNSEGDEKIVKVLLEEKVYPFEKLNVPKEKVEYSKKDLERITKETELLAKIYEQSIGALLFQGTFETPLNAQITSQYGAKRLFNDKKNSQHLGIDFKANIGTPIKVSNSGKVVLAQDLFFTGNTVIIDHGLGVFTMYGHLSKIYVKENETIFKNTMIGLSGNTGRVTGPHLHWGVKVQGNWVDGNSLIEETETL
jgi:murein DD-endopeptidase MepM/ murein hydrolase activator NlpD